MRFLFQLAAVLYISTNVFADPISNDSGGDRDEDGFLKVSFADISQFEYVIDEVWDEEGNMTADTKSEVPVDIQNMTGESITIDGYIMPVSVEEGGLIVEALLMANQNACCYGKMPQPNEWILVKIPGGSDIMAMDMLVRVRGNLRVAPEFEDGLFIGMYHMETNEIELVSGEEIMQTFQN